VGLFHSIKVRLGLADDWDDEYDDEYYDDDDEYDESPEPRGGDGFFGRRAASYESPYGADARHVKRLGRDDVDRARDRDSAPLRPVPSAGSVTSMKPQVTMHITEPKTFTEAQAIADRLKSGTPVIMNLTMTKPDLAKRLIDFASGLTYGIDGGLQKVSDKVFMLTPANVDVSAEDKRRLRDKGLFNME
jgi:cell division inhibitor SepF